MNANSLHQDRSDAGLVLVVGAAGGVGAAVTADLLRSSYRVIGTVLDARERDLVLAASPDVEEVSILDLSHADAVARNLLCTINRHGGRLQSAVVCAATPSYGPLELIPVADFRQVIEVNVVSNLAVYQATLPFLRKNRGRIVFLSSNASRCPFPFIGAYVASKHALAGLTDVMRQEAALSGVDVIAVEPGSMCTGMVTRQQETVGGDHDKLPMDARLRYGGYYRGFEAALRLIAQTGMTPSVVSDVILNVLSAESPLTRYVIGSDAEISLKMRKDMSDRELDAAYHSLLFKPEIQSEQPQKGESDSGIR